MLFNSVIERNRFSWAIFVICICEFLFWSTSTVAAAHDIGSLAGDTTFKTYIARDVHTFTLSANVIDSGAHLPSLLHSSSRAAEVARQQILEEESYAIQHNGKDANQPNSAMGYVAWGVATALSVVLGIGQARGGASESSASAGASQSKGKEDGSSSSDSSSSSSSSASSSTSSISSSRYQSSSTSNATTITHDAVNSTHGRAEKAPAPLVGGGVGPVSKLSNSAPPQQWTASELSELSDEELLAEIDAGRLSAYTLESKLEDTTRAVALRRKMLTRSLGDSFDMNAIPFENYDYDQVKDKCCENVIGYLPIPIGVVGPVNVNGSEFKIPMATTEGCLVASTHRGCKAITMSGGANSVIVDRGMTRGPCVRMPDCKRAADLKAFVESPSGSKILEDAFNSTTRFGKLKSIKVNLAGRNAYMRFKAFTGDAMGMNMISKGCEKALDILGQRFPDMELVAISGNFCTDKKPAAVNWIEGRGRSVVADVVIKGDIIRDVLKTSVAALVDVNINKNLVGSAMAGSIGGFNAHASNIVTAIYLATGQDPAQNVESSNCITLMEAINDGQDLYMSVTMPSIEVGTVGGGTALPAQSACLEMISAKGSHKSSPGQNADQLAQLVAVSVLAGELSLMSALAAGHLVSSHMQFNRGPAAAANASATPAGVAHAHPVRQLPAISSSVTAAGGDKRTPLVPGTCAKL
jgi:hydroxymethylglutaryl-CoA reductase (NADPH)